MVVIKPDMWLMDFACENVQNFLKWHSFHQSVQTDIWTGQSLSPNWAEVSALLVGQLCTPQAYHTQHNSPPGHPPQALCHGNGYQQRSNTNTHTLIFFRCLQPNIQGMCEDQDLKVSVTLNWLEEGERDENIYSGGVLGGTILLCWVKLDIRQATFTKGAQ